MDEDEDDLFHLPSDLYRYGSNTLLVNAVMNLRVT
jgi:hypothetical protein